MSLLREVMGFQSMKRLLKEEGCGDTGLTLVLDRRQGRQG